MRSEARESVSRGIDISWENRAGVLERLMQGEAANILVTQGLEVILSMRSHKQIEMERGIDDDQILLEGLVEIQGGRVLIDSSFHGSTKIAEKLIPDIENELSDTIGRWVH